MADMKYCAVTVDVFIQRRRHAESLPPFIHEILIEPGVLGPFKAVCVKCKEPVLVEPLRS